MFTLENLLNIEGLRVPQTKLGAVEGSKATEHTIVETETVISGKVLFLRIGERMVISVPSTENAMCGR